MTTARALASYEARFSRGPADPTLHACTCCRYEAETVDSHGHCGECRAAREAADEAEAAGPTTGQFKGELASDEGFTAWCAARLEAAIADQLAAEERPLPRRLAA